MTALASPLVEVERPARPASRRTLVRGVMRVVLFWWLATGAIFAMQRNAGTRVISLLATTALLFVGGRLIVRSRDDRSVNGAERGFLGAALVWLWIATTFYGGWLVGPELPSFVPELPGRFPLAMLAIRAMSYHELVGVAAIALTYALHGRNPVAWVTLLTFWGAEQLAQLNVFFGVASPGLRFLPPHLAFLGAFFGPEQNSALLVPSVVLVAGLSVWWFRRAARSYGDFDRIVGVLFGVLLALASLEYAVLGVRWDVPLWDLFLRARGG